MVDQRVRIHSDSRAHTPRRDIFKAAEGAAHPKKNTGIHRCLQGTLNSLIIGQTHAPIKTLETERKSYPTVPVLEGVAWHKNAVIRENFPRVLLKTCVCSSRQQCTLGLVFFVTIAQICDVLCMAIHYCRFDLPRVLKLAPPLS